MSDETEEVVEVVVWRQYLTVVKTAHRRAWFWAFLAGAVVAVAVTLLLGAHKHCHVEAYPVVVEKLIYVPEHPHRLPPPVVVVPPPAATSPAKPPAHVVHRVVHRVVRHHCHG